ncbi:MAG: hypothetical protein GY711_21885 [bacterium]|nr:hypothetical protein [bacterium]
MTLSIESASDRGILGVLRAVARVLLRIPRLRAILPAVLWAGGIWLLSSLRSLNSPEVHIVRAFLGNLAHAFEFGILALFLVLLLPRTQNWVRLTPRTIAAAAWAAILFGLVDEVHQSYVPGRDASLLDWVTDIVGVFCVLKMVTYVSSHEASPLGTSMRLGYASVLCCVAAGFATLYSFLYGEGPWIG